MAQKIREGNGLPTLRCGIGLRESEAVMVTRPFLGAEPLGPVLRTPVSLFEHRPEDALRDDVRGFGGVEQQIDTLDEEAPYGPPLWLQIERDSTRAGIFDWERLIAMRTGRAALRIPNFLRNPIVPRGVVHVAICASGGADTSRHITALLETLEHAAEGSYTAFLVMIFTDRQTRDGITLHPGKRVVAQLVSADDFGDQSGSGDGRGNTWLRWIADRYRGRPLDVVHFICPGLLSGESGALALPEMPMAAEGPARSAGARELTAFYDRVGCTTMGFTPLGNRARQDGIRALAYELGWNRPGPILVGDRGLVPAYRAIIANDAPSSRAVGDYPPFCCIHPDLVEPGEGDAIASMAESHDMRDDARDFAVDISRGADVARGGGPDVFGRPPGRFIEVWSDVANYSPGRTLAETIIANERARISSVLPRSKRQKAQDTGTARALDFLQGVLER